MKHWPRNQDRTFLRRKKLILALTKNTKQTTTAQSKESNQPITKTKKTIFTVNNVTKTKHKRNTMKLDLAVRILSIIMAASVSSVNAQKLRGINKDGVGTGGKVSTAGETLEKSSTNKRQLNLWDSIGHVGRRETQASTQNPTPSPTTLPKSTILAINPNNNCFEAHEDAATLCGGHLASVGSDEDTLEIKRLFDLYVTNHHSVYLGGEYNNGSGSWSWMDGTSFDYTNWSEDPDEVISMIGSDKDYAIRGRCSSSECQWQPMEKFWVMPGAYRLPANYMDKNLYPNCDETALSF